MDEQILRDGSIDHLAVRMPNWLGDVCMALPILRAMQRKQKEQNHDVRFSIFIQKQYIPLLKKMGVEGEMIGLPKKNWRYYFSFLSWRGKFDAYVLFTNSERGDLEAWLTGAKKRYGISRPNKTRKLLTDKYNLNEGFDEQAVHQSDLWAQFVGSFGLIGSVDFSPFSVNSEKKSQVGLICGSSNAPEKRWGTDCWQEVVVDLLQRYDEVLLLGTATDVPVCDDVQSAFLDVDRVKNLAGSTGMSELVNVICQMQLVIGNDTGGLHLANALGVPVVGLYGVTNAVRCGPVFSANVAVVESPGGFGEGSMGDLSVGSVLRGALDAVKLS